MPKLFFIYNAGSGFFEGLTDFAHKILSPKTYACKLCSLTYGNTSMHKEWKDYINHLPFETEFYHKDETSKLGLVKEVELPLVLSSDDSKDLSVLITASEINEMESLSDLILLMNQRLSRLKH